MIVPTVGRVVLFVPRESAYQFGYCLEKGAPHAAIVARAHSNTCVNLTVFDAHGKPFGKTSVTLRQPGDPEPAGDYCEWMPYQVEQSAKQAQPQS